MTPLLLSLIISGNSIIVVFPDQPVSVSVSYRASGCVALPAATKFAKAWTFIGTDRGDILEADIQLSSSKLDYFLQRSEHREAPGQYDAWKSEPIVWAGNEICAQVSATPTAGKPVRVHFQVRLEKALDKE